MLLNQQTRNLIKIISKKMFKLGLADEKVLYKEILERYLLTKSREEMENLG